METCKYGSGAGKRKPTAVKRKGVVYRAYVRPEWSLNKCFFSKKLGLGSI